MQVPHRNEFKETSYNKTNFYWRDRLKQDIKRVKMFISRKVFYMYLPCPFVTGRTCHKVNFKAELVWIQQVVFFIDHHHHVMPPAWISLTFINHNKAKEPSLPNNLSIAGWRDEFISFSRTIVQSETQAALSRIWTQVTYSFSYDKNYNTKHASYIYIYIYIYIYCECACVCVCVCVWSY